MRKIFIFLLIIGIGVGTYFGIKSLSKQGEPAKTIEQPNEIVYKLVSIERLQELPGDISANGTNEWLVVKVFGQNHDTVNRLFNMYYFTFEDEEGNIYENNPNSLNDAIIYGELVVDGTISGTIVFKVPAESVGKLIITDEEYIEVQELNIK
ncbi:MAG: hypothetical protein FD141_1016 [Fusobacteria bacterium]|nr:MAG: hypothetical protein FD141_1016 [Fusobacteriota bacterium]KAF0229729.1 MAG: hypothetical protein FD182_119 [Fusobacteriota bacterium]